MVSEHEVSWGGGGFPGWVKLRLSTSRIWGKRLVLTGTGILVLCESDRFVLATGCASSGCPCGTESQGPTYTLTPRAYSDVWLSGAGRSGSTRLRREGTLGSNAGFVGRTAPMRVITLAFTRRNGTGESCESDAADLSFPPKRAIRFHVP